MCNLNPLASLLPNLGDFDLQNFEKATGSPSTSLSNDDSIYRNGARADQFALTGLVEDAAIPEAQIDARSVRTTRLIHSERALETFRDSWPSAFLGALR